MKERCAATEPQAAVDAARHGPALRVAARPAAQGALKQEGVDLWHEAA